MYNNYCATQFHFHFHLQCTVQTLAVCCFQSFCYRNTVHLYLIFIALLSFVSFHRHFLIPAFLSCCPYGRLHSPNSTHLLISCLQVFRYRNNAYVYFPCLYCFLPLPLIAVVVGSGARFSKVPKSFRARKATRKTLSLTFTELFISHNFNTNKVSFHAKFNAYTLFSFWDTDH